MHFSELDYDTLTENGRLCTSSGGLGRLEFYIVIKKQIDGYVRRKLQRSISETFQQEDFALMASVKLLLEAVDQLKLASHVGPSGVVEHAGGSISPVRGRSPSRDAGPASLKGGGGGGAGMGMQMEQELEALEEMLRESVAEAAREFVDPSRSDRQADRQIDR